MEIKFPGPPEAAERKACILSTAMAGMNINFKIYSGRRLPVPMVVPSPAMMVISMIIMTFITT